MSEGLIAIIVAGLALVGTLTREWLTWRGKDAETIVQRQKDFENSVNQQEEKLRAELFEQYQIAQTLAKEVKAAHDALEKKFRDWRRLADRRMDRMEAYIRKQPDGEAVLLELPPRPNGEYGN